jgi:nicotinamidase-related amidase
MSPPALPPTSLTEEELAGLLEAALAGRQERVLALALAQESPEMRAAFAAVGETLAALGLALGDRGVAAPSPGLRDRILASVVARRAGAAPARTALLVLDMIKEHLRPGGPMEVPRARAIVPAIRRRLDAARAAGTPIVYLVDEHDPSDADLHGVEGWGAHAIRGTEGTEVWPELAPQPADLIVKKATYSAFTGSTLAQVLDELAVDSIVLTGCLTELGMLATATDALQRGFAVEVPPDAQAGANEMVERVTLGILALMPPYGAARRARIQTIASR